MGLFSRKKQRNEDNDDQNGERKKEKGSWRRPANTAFKQQRLKAWQPILTPKTVLPTLFITGIIFAPIGGLLVWGSSLVSEMAFDYTDCWNLTSASSLDNLNFVDMPSYSYNLRSSDSGKSFSTPQYAYLLNSTTTLPNETHACYIRFDVVADLPASVFQYYKLTNYYQNNRRYVQSLDTSQLQGDYVSQSDLSSSNCKPLAVTSDGKGIYPCGLIANSVFNDTFSGFRPVNTTGASDYNFTQSGIAWPGEAKRYSATSGYVGKFNEIAPPPNWALRYPNGYSNDTPPPNLQADEHFQNWMRTAGLPTFSKLYGRNDTTTLPAGQYEVQIYLNYPVQGFGGTKSLVISTVSWIGGKNPFLGWAYVAAAGVFVLLALAGTIRHLFKPRRLGDMSLLSWNR
ncbi:ligand-effect modulator 3 family [Chiua virens]|nr:ligand-effect modulator 3 family [Chiua virens]